MKKAIISVLITALMFATLEPVSSQITGVVHPAAMTAIRFIIGGLILLPFAIGYIKKNGLKLSFKDFLKIGALSILFICISMVLLQYGVAAAKNAGTSPAVVAIIFSGNSVFTLLLSAIFLKEKLTPKKIFGVALCLVGIIICSDITSGVSLWSSLMALSAAISFSIYTIISKKLIARIGGVVLNCFSFLIGGGILALFLLIIGVDFINVSSFSLGAFGILLYLAVFVTGVGYTAYLKAIEYGTATVASLAFFVKPILTPIVCLILLGTPVSLNVIISLFFVAAGSYYVMVLKR